MCDITGIRKLRKIIKHYQFLYENTSEYNPIIININTLIKFLLTESYLRSIKFNVYRSELLYVWRSVSEYLLLPVIKPKGYYSHLSAVYFNEFIKNEPNNIYFNNEQSERRMTTSGLEQNRIDLAFSNKQRMSNAKTIINDKTFWLINGKQSGNYGVIQKQISPGVEILVTNIERTLIDIVVRPMYSGGPEKILQVYRLAKPMVSIQKLADTLRALDYIYPYHQSIGFYLERTGMYNQQDLECFSNFNEIKYDFFLDYQMR